MKATSVDTYNEIKENGLLSEKRMRVYDILYEYGHLTGTQVATIYKNKFPSKSTSETIRNRITELVKMECVDELGEIYCPISKRNVTLFGVNDNLPKKYELPPTLKQRRDEILLQISEYAKTLPKEHLDGLRSIYRKVEKIAK
jgi:hypothetical protein